MNKNRISRHLVWEQIHRGVWRARAGAPEPFTLLEASGARANSAALDRLPDAVFPFDAGEIEAVADGRKTCLRFPLGSDESIYGLGLDFKAVRRNQTVQMLHMDAWAGVTGRTHAPVPLYASSAGYAVLVDSARYVDFYVGTATRIDAKRPPAVYDRNLEADKWQAVPPSDTIEVSVPAAGAVVLVFAGPTVMDAVRRYNLTCGGGCLPPRQGLGFMMRMPALATQTDIVKEIDEFDKRGLPLDMIGLEPGWHDHSYPCSFEWDRTRFPDPPRLASTVDDRRVSLNFWFNPYVKRDTDLGKTLEPYAGSHLVWNGIAPDYSLPEARDAFAAHLSERLLALGPAAGGMKVDEVDGGDVWLWPDAARFPSGLDAEQLRQSYGLLIQRLVLDLYRSHDRRTYGLARGTNAGSPALPFVLYSDSYDFDEYLTAVCNSGFCGVLWSPEVRGASTSDEWLRRIQLVCMSSLAMLNGYASNLHPWAFEDVADDVRDVMLLREQLIPYLYTTFAQYLFDGTPVIRPMQLVPGFAGKAISVAAQFHDTLNPYQLPQTHVVHDQYMLGDWLLVAPLSPGQSSRSVQLPEGRWYDFHTGQFAGEGGVMEIRGYGNKIPLFVPNGAIIPMTSPASRAPRAEDRLPLTVRHYGDRESAWRLYDDDGVTFAYERGEFSWTALRASRDPSGALIGEAAHEGPAAAFGYPDITWRFMTA